MATKQIIVVRRDLNMRKGKMCAQVAHAAMMFLTRNNSAENPMQVHVELSKPEADWLQNSFTKIVVGVDSEDELNAVVYAAHEADVEVHVCIDNGTTEFHGVKTMTCAAFGPEDEEVLNKITGHLKLL
jgi:PTH2 family peptidyl-tRNA hydrolase